MAEIKSLKVLGKTSATSSDVLLVTNTSTNSATRYSVANLFPALSTLGTGSTSLFVNVTNKNQLNFKGIKSSAPSMLGINTINNNLVFNLRPSGINLNQCDNSKSGFIRSLDLSKSVSGTLTPTNGGTGLQTFKKGSIVVASSDDNWGTALMQTDGQLLMGNSTTGYPTIGKLVQGTNIAITNTPGKIIISANLRNLTANFGCNAYNIDLDRAVAASWISGDGSDEGMTVDAAGKVFIGNGTPTLPSAGQLGQLQLGGSDAQAIVIGSSEAYADRSIVHVAAPTNTNGSNLTLLASDAGSSGYHGGDLLLKAGSATNAGGSGNGGDVEIHGGSENSSGNAGSIMLKTYTSSKTEKTALTVDATQNVITASGSIIARTSSVPSIIKYQGAQATSDDGTAVVSAANILTGIVECTPTADRSKATDTATNLVAALNLTVNNDSVDWILINLATDGAQNVTLTAGTGVTLVGNMVVHAQDAADDAVSIGTGSFRIRRTGSTAVTMYRIG